ncbi:MAG: hypothetical protein K2Q15_03500 [Burkholderiales bacterium]|nr:hypothetical protein [Burkholderiales bacterium]
MFRSISRRVTAIHYQPIRTYSIASHLAVSQKKNTSDCTRASIATIVNNIRKQPVANITSVNNSLLANCETMREKGIDGLQPAMETKASHSIFNAFGLRSINIEYSPEKLSNIEIAKQLIPTLKVGMYLCTCQPPGNSENVSHSVVLVDITINASTQAIEYHIFDPYPRPDRNEKGIRILNATALLKEKMTTNVFISKI